MPAEELHEATHANREIEAYTEELLAEDEARRKEDEARRKEEKRQLLQDIFADAPLNQDADAESRMQTGTEYYNHLEKMSKRDDGYQPGVDDYDTRIMELAHSEALAENAEYDRLAAEVIQAEKDRITKIESLMATDARYRRLLAIGNEIATRGAQRLTGEEDEARLQQILSDKEEKFQELFDKLEADGGDHDALYFILEKAHPIRVNNTEVAQTPQSSGEVAEEEPIETIDDENAESAENAEVEDDPSVSDDESEEQEEPVSKEDSPEDDIDSESQDSPDQDQDQDAGENNGEIAEAERSWWQNQKSRLKGMFRMDKWATMWAHAAGNIREGILNIGVRQDMLDEEKERKRKRNRNLIVGGTLVLVAFTAAKNVGAFDWLDGIDVSASPLDHDPATSDGTETTSDVGKDVNDIEKTEDKSHDNEPNKETDEDGQSRAELRQEREDYTVETGSGGEQLFQQLGIDPQEWYQYEDQLLNRFPDEFYRMDGGHVGINNPGVLPAEVRDYINRIRG